jgi:hypothetical protein
LNELDPTTNYIQLLEKAVAEFQITPKHQPKLEVLIPWFEEELMKLEKVKKRATELATFVLMPGVTKE